MSYRQPDSRIQCSIDLDYPGRQVGDLMLRYSDDRQPLGYYPVPIVCIAGGDGPTALLVGGVHGDEFEGPVALMRLARELTPQQVRGRIVILPALNHPAVTASRRTSPLDGMNLNRTFPGDRNGGPTAMLAHFVEDLLIPISDLVVDLHAGGQAAVFAPCALATRCEDEALFKRNLELACAFGAPLVWLLGASNDDRSVNAAAVRKGIPMIAAEMGGGGGCDPVHAGMAEAGMRRCLAYLDMIEDPSPPMPPPRLVENASPSRNLHAPCRGLFDRAFTAGDEVVEGQHAGFVHVLEEPSREPARLVFPGAGVVLAHGNRGHVERGEMLAMVACDAAGPGPAQT